MPDCVFCKIVKGEIPSLKIYEDKDVFAFLDIQPANPGHALVVTKRHHANLAETPDDELGHLFITAKRVGKNAAAAVGASGFNVIVNNGTDAGQIVPHVHVHAIPRFADDGHHHWEKRPVTDEEMKAIAAKLTALFL